MFSPGRDKHRLDEHEFALGFSSRGSSVKMDTGGSRISKEHRLNSTTKTKRDPETRNNDLGIFEGVLSRSKLEREYRKYNRLYKKGEVHMDQVTPALIRGTRHHRTREKVMETMSKRNYVIGTREPISGDRSLRR